MKIKFNFSIMSDRFNFSYIYIVLFSIAMIPFSINIGGQGISANFLYILFPLLFILYSMKVYFPVYDHKCIVLIYLVIFTLSFYQLSNIEYIDRKIISFIIFLGIFSFSLINVNDKMINSFKFALISAAFILAIVKLSIYFSRGGIELGWAAKHEVGSARIGFIYILSIFLLFYTNTSQFRYLLLKYFFIFVCLGGLLLTFSRSGIVSILVTVAIFIIVHASSWLLKSKKFRFRISYKTLFLFAATLCMTIVILNYLSVTIEYYSSRLFSLTDTDGIKMFNFENPETSQGYRIHMLSKIFNYVLNHPFNGSGFLGVWIMFEDLTGSAHNQYADVLFRTGFIGLLTYIYLLYNVMVFLYKKDAGLFWGMIGVLIYGLFVETFKETQGAFILSFLIGAHASKIRRGLSESKQF